MICLYFILHNRKDGLPMITIDDLKNLCINTSQKLIKMPSETIGFNKNPERNLRTKLIFPRYKHSNTTRVSEQEARFVFCQEIEAYYKEIFYSIETPTRKKYSFSSKNTESKKFRVGYGQSAMSDVSLFEREENELKQKIDIEFTARNVARAHISKDILKLLCEDNNGLSFHLLEAVDSGTLKGLMLKYQNSRDDYEIEDKYKAEIKEYDYILFVVCCIKPAFLLSKTIMKTALINPAPKLFEFDYRIDSGKIESDDFNGWECLAL